MAVTKNQRNTKGNDSNPDPITGAPGSHPVGTGVGAAVGGAAAGAAAGVVGGPVGAAAGAVIGAVAGGFGGKAVAEKIDPTVEDAYWRSNYAQRPYYSKDVVYDEVSPAYRYGWESRSRYADKQFEEVEPDLERGWSTSRGNSKLDWERAREATRDAWHRVERAIPGDADKDGR